MLHYALAEISEFSNVILLIESMVGIQFRWCKPWTKLYTLKKRLHPCQVQMWLGGRGRGCGYIFGFYCCFTLKGTWESPQALQIVNRKYVFECGNSFVVFHQPTNVVSFFLVGASQTAPRFQYGNYIWRDLCRWPRLSAGVNLES